MLDQLTQLLVTRHGEHSWWDKSVRKRGEGAWGVWEQSGPMWGRKENWVEALACAICSEKSLAGRTRSFWAKVIRQWSPVSPRNWHGNGFGKPSLGLQLELLQLHYLQSEIGEMKVHVTPRKNYKDLHIKVCDQILQLRRKIRFEGNIHCLEAELTL